MTSNAEILLKFIQGDAGKAWANLHVGWKVGSKGTVLCLSYFCFFLCVKFVMESIERVL
jgi:hypothetical protein